MSADMRFVTDLAKGILGQADSSKLWTDIISHIPDSILLEPNVKILNIAFGHGTEADILVRRMLSLGVPADKVKNSIYLLDKYRVFTNRAVRKGYTNVITADFLKWETEMKFDVIVGNPPYQAPKKGDYSFWARFVDKAHNLLDKQGYLGMVIPAGWMSPTNDIRQGQRSVMRDIFAKEDTSYINVDPELGKKFFPGIGQKFTWFFLQKGKYQITKFDFGNNTLDVDISKMPMLSKELDSISISIISKISSLPQKWEFTRHIMRESWDEVSFEKTSKFKFKRINGNSNHLKKIVYAESACKTQKLKKVVLPYNGSDYLFVVDDKKFGCTNAYVMLLSDSDLIESAKVYFESPLIKWLGNNKFTQYNEGALINSVSKIDLTKILTLQGIYNFYNLTQEEIDYIENAVK